MVHELEPIHVCQVVHLLEASRQATDVFKAEVDQFSNEEAVDVLVELANRDFVCFLQGCLRQFVGSVFVLV